MELLKDQQHLKMEETDEEDEEMDEREQNWDDWNEDDDDVEGGASDSQLVCLFCDSKFSSSNDLFKHCVNSHQFDFVGVKKALSLDFYGCFRLINYIRSQVAENSSWSSSSTCQSIQQLESHAHGSSTSYDVKRLWEDDKYLTPFMQDDALLYSFCEEDDGEEDDVVPLDKEEQMKIVENFDGICFNDGNDIEMLASDSVYSSTNSKDTCTIANSVKPLTKLMANGNDAKQFIGLLDGGDNSKHLGASFANVAAKEIKNVNKSYFGAYSSFGIHREMLSDKVRMDAYSQAILNNPSLFNSAVVLDVGCGTCILSLFAAQAGASEVIAVEASEKMAAVATKIAKDNGRLFDGSRKEGNDKCTGVIKVVNSMVEDIDKSVEIQPGSVDVLLSEWMGYCLLYETMLSSVIFARDKWLKPGGAILPDTATIFVAGFGKGGTSIPFWETVYGFNMSSVGKELVEDAAKNPIVDIVDGRDIVTESVVLKTFDLATMKSDEMDFTASIELEALKDTTTSTTGTSVDSNSETTWCYGIVLWFDTGFTSRFCKEMATNLSTSPYTQKTHWAQTIFTFQEPVALHASSVKPNTDRSAAVGTEASPAQTIHSRISIVRAALHRSIDISLEVTGIASDGRRRSWPVQIFNLC